MENLFTKEWLVTNSIGGYASGTEQNANTRRYHGLLVAALNPPTDRKVLVAKVEERILFQENYYDLSANQYPEVIYPKGYEFLKSFSIAPIPCWNYENDLWQLEKSICMKQHSNTTFVSYTNKGKSSFILELHPLYVYTNYHSTFHENNTTDFYSEIEKNTLKTFPKYGSQPIVTKWNLGNFKKARTWYKNVQLPQEEIRGLDYEADYYRIGYISYDLQPNETLILGFSTEEEFYKADLKKLFNSVIAKSNKKAFSITKSTFYNDLLKSGNQFIVHRKSTKSTSIIAGYHWFSDWGRDSLIAMRGLTIATGNKKTSKSILSTFLKSINQGMIPNRFPDFSEDNIEYNTIDGTLWLFIAMYEYYLTFNDLDFIKKNLKKLKGIIDWHIKGTRFNIHVTQEGFLCGGQDGVQLTWMDAIVNGKVITPRIGCPVEINALWYNALKIYEFFCKKVNLSIELKYSEILTKFKNNFSAYFLKSDGTLYDVIVPNNSSDSSFRPNQIYWLSLPFTLLTKNHQKVIFEAVKEKLFTPYGLRTLAIQNSEFIGFYEGNQWNRDHAYHQGTVWPFLINEYYEAFFKIYGRSAKNKKKVISELQILKEHFYSEEGLHCISEVFDGLNPKQGKGTIQQAWSVAALIKLYANYNLYEINE